METKVAIIDHVGIKAGMDCYDLGLSRALKNQGCEVKVYSNFKSDEPGVFNVFPFRLNQNLFSFYQLLEVYRQISKELSRNNIQHCILHGFRFGLADWLMLKALKRSSVSINMIVHDPESLLGIRQSKRWKEKIFDSCQAIIVHNDFSAAELSKELSEEEKKKMAVIPHGNFIDTAVKVTGNSSFISEKSPDKKKKYLLFFGHIKRVKGLDLLLKAMKHTNPAVCLIIAGRMRKHSFNEYQSLIDECKLNNRVRVLKGYISPEQRNELFQFADAVVLPYKKVYQSGVMLMAMSYGKAVIASDLLPNKEIITDHKNGFLFTSGDEKSLSSAIENVLDNDQLRNDVALAGRNYVQSKHDWNQIASQWIKLFSK